MERVNHRRNTRTVIEVHQAVYDVDIPEKYFNPQKFYR